MGTRTYCTARTRYGSARLFPHIHLQSRCRLRRLILEVGERRRLLAMSSPFHKPATPWSRIPTHLLDMSSHVHGHARFYSAHSRNPSNGSDDPETTTSQTLPKLASSFGFQSLSGLFQQQAPSQSRYSRSREPKQDEMPVSLAPKQESGVTPLQHAEPSTIPTNVGVEFFQLSNRQADNLDSARTDGKRYASVGQPHVSPLEPSKPTEPPHSAESTGPTELEGPVARAAKLMVGVRHRRHVRVYPSSDGGFKRRQQKVPRRQPNPFLASPPPPSAFRRIIAGSQPDVSQPWGLSPGNKGILNSVSGPSAESAPDAPAPPKQCRQKTKLIEFAILD